MTFVPYRGTQMQEDIITFLLITWSCYLSINKFNITILRMLTLSIDEKSEINLCYCFLFHNIRILGVSVFYRIPDIC